MMTPASPHQLSLLADQLHLSILERRRGLSLNAKEDGRDADIARELSNLQEGLSALESRQQPTREAGRLRVRYTELFTLYYGRAPKHHSNPAIDLPSASDDASAPPPNPPRVESRQAAAPQRSKNVRFRDDGGVAEDDSQETANRAALFSDQERYRDDPDGPDQSQLENTQIHAQHKQVMREQDQQLNVLGQSVGRQRMLGIQMGDELDEQNQLLDDVERGVDRNTATLGRARRRLNNVAKRSRDNWNWVTIGALIVILVVLIIVLN